MAFLGLCLLGFSKLKQSYAIFVPFFYTLTPFFLSPPFSSEPATSILDHWSPRSKICIPNPKLALSIRAAHISSFLDSVGKQVKH